MKLALPILATALFACAADPDGEPDGDDGQPRVRIISPTQGQLILRDTLDADGLRIAPVSIEASGPEGADIELWLDGEKIADTTTFELAATQARFYELEARAVSGGELVASSLVQFGVQDPNFSCEQWLDLFSIESETGPVREGVAESITVVPPIGGIDYRFLGDATLRADLSADCSLIVALADSAPILRARGVVEVVDIGVYNYRCIGGGTPPNCPEGISQHAFATAIDIAGYLTSDGEYYSVNDDWVIDSGGSTCGAVTENTRDEFLHEIICAQKAAGIWNIVLTPNFNAAHRNHFHVDLTPNGDFTRRAAGIDVDLGPSGH